MHFTTEINRPPYEAGDAYLQVTSGCTHHRCRFCTLFHTPFRVSPLEEVKEDLAELRDAENYYYDRIFLQGADAFTLSYEKLMVIADLIHEYLPHVKSIGAYARVDSMKQKSVEQLRNLKSAGYESLAIGLETGDDVLLERMTKGYTSDEIIEYLSKLDETGIGWMGTFLNGLGGHNYGDRHAMESARVYNQLRPLLIFVPSLTLFPDTPLQEDIRTGTFVEATEIERLTELRDFVSNLTLSTVFQAIHVSMPVRVAGYLPQDKDKIVNTLQKAIDTGNEGILRNYRDNVYTL